VAVAAALLAGAAAGWALRRAPAAHARAVTFSIPPAKGAPYNGMLALSPDGRQLAFVASGDDGNDRIFLRALGALEPRAVAGTEGASFPFFSPDGRRLGFFTGQSLKTLDVGTLAVQTLCKAKNVRGGSWGSSEQILFSPNDGAEIDVVAASGGEPKKVIGFDATRHESSLRWPLFLRDGRRFLYLSFVENGNELALASLDGGARRRIVKADSPAFLAEGSLVYATGERLVAQPFDEKAARITGAARPLAEGVYWDAFASGAFGFAVSDDGDLAYLAGGIGKSRLVWYDRAGHRLESAGPLGALFEPSVSPDGSRASISMADIETGRSRVWLVDLARGGVVQISDQPSSSVTSLFSHDGSSLVFSTFPDGRIYTRDMSGAAPSRLVFDAGIFAILEHWAADGRLFYTTLDLTNYHMQSYVLPPGGKPEPVLTGPANTQHTQLSPDGRWLAYVSDESGREEVLVRSYPEGRQRFAISASGGTQPQWKGDGRELFYVTPDRKMMSVEMPAPGAGEPSRPRVLFQSRILPEIESRNHYAVTRDGQRFLVNERVEEESSRPIVVVLNAVR
jgi:Tol biopolymer transport system component